MLHDVDAYVDIHVDVHENDDDEDDEDDDEDDDDDDVAAAEDGAKALKPLKGFIAEVAFRNALPNAAKAFEELLLLSSDDLLIFNILLSFNSFSDAFCQCPASDCEDSKSSTSSLLNCELSFVLFFNML